MPPVRVTLMLVALSLPGCKLGRETNAADAHKRWTDMNQGERMTHMSGVVEPAMREAFQGHDPERFADFGCQTCHAADGYDMPNPGLPRLDPSGFFKKHRKETPEMVHFMWKRVEKDMAVLLGVTHGDHGYLACRSCHVVDD